MKVMIVCDYHFENTSSDMTPFISNIEWDEKILEIICEPEEKWELIY